MYFIYNFSLYCYFICFYLPLYVMIYKIICYIQYNYQIVFRLFQNSLSVFGNQLFGCQSVCMGTNSDAAVYWSIIYIICRWHINYNYVYNIKILRVFLTTDGSHRAMYIIQRIYTYKQVLISTTCRLQCISFSISATIVIRGASTVYNIYLL